MITLTPALLVGAANAFVGLSEEGGDNRGQMIELFLREVNQPAGQPWCAAFVYHVGYWSHFDHKSGQSSWPLPQSASCAVLGEFASRARILMEQPQDGDVFLKYSKRLNRFFHTGVIITVESREPVCLCATVEGNTDADGSENGYTTLRRIRRFAPEDRFIRWVDAHTRRKAA